MFTVTVSAPLPVVPGLMVSFPLARVMGGASATTVVSALAVAPELSVTVTNA